MVLYVQSNLSTMRKGKNIKNQNVESPKVDQKFEKDQNFESLFKIDQNIDSQKFVKGSECQKCEKMTS
jgi:hypothetical protein